MDQRPLDPGKGFGDLQEMLFQKGVNWNDYPSFFKRGVFVQRKEIVKGFPATPEEIALLPEKHEARRNPDLEIKRTVIRTLEMPPLSRPRELGGRLSQRSFTDRPQKSSAGVLHLGGACDEKSRLSGRVQIVR